MAKPSIEQVELEENLDSMTHFFNLLSGGVTYSHQLEAWDRLCREHGTDGRTVFAILRRAYDAR